MELILWLISLLISILILYIVCRVVIWALGLFGFKDPKVEQIIYAIGALIVLYWLVAGLMTWPTPRYWWR